LIKERSHVLKPIEKNIADIMKNIENSEKELAQLNEAIIEASQTQNGKKISELSQSIFKCKSVIDDLFNELEKMTIEQEQKQNFFDKRLADLAG
jgi:ATP-binding cassette subfamily F protein 3